ncbi:MAG: hypothetical protein KC478_10350 [Bacteriovoracaceae bacterium]|nr:hypothetical protein [Bacteriovoracaceae bacterium]
MKFTLLAIATLLITGANANEAVRVFDGLSASCSSKADSVNASLGAYKLRTKTVQINSHGELKLKVELKFLKCADVHGNYKFVETSPLGTVERNTYSGTVSTTINAVEIKAYEDGVYDLLLNEELDYRSRQTVSLTTRHDNLVNLEEGKSKTVAIDFFITKSISTVSNNKVFDSVVPFGAYRIKVQVSKANNELTTKVLN